MTLELKAKATASDKWPQNSGSAAGRVRNAHSRQQIIYAHSGT